MTTRQHQLIREYRAGIINRRSFIYGWGKEQGLYGKSVLELIATDLKKYEQTRERLA